MVDFNEFNYFLTNFPYAAFIAAASNNILLLASLHWFPWSFHLGRPLSRYQAFLSGCTSIILSFGLWALLQGDFPAWLTLVLILVPLHWPMWFVRFMYTISHVKAYSIASLPIILVFAAWGIGTENYNAGLCLAGLYATGGVATSVFYYLDRIGMSEHIVRNDKH